MTYFIIINLSRQSMKPIFILLIILLSFIPTQSQYTKQWSRTLNRLSAITHCSQQQILNWSCKICKEQPTLKLTHIKYIYFALTNVMAYVGYMQQKNIIIVSLRGTVDIKNWIQNFSYKQVTYIQCKGCLVHQGFYLDFLTVSGQIKDHVIKILGMYQGSRVVVTGSSLGGALATIVALEVQLATGNVQQLHVFGCPRVGNPSFAQFLKLKVPKIYRVIHNHDIVPHVPLQSQNYHHVSKQILFDQQMDNYRQCDQSGEDPTCSDSYYPNFSIPDHTSYWYRPVEVDVCNP